MTIDIARDTDGMLGAIAAMPAHLDAGVGAAAQTAAAVQARWQAAAGDAAPRTVIVCGMGGSGVGADLIPAVFDTSVPVVAVKDYTLPTWAGAQDAVICVSYSGGTEETLSCWEAAGERCVRVAAVTTGGELGASAGEAGVPVITVESGLQPRAAVGWLFSALAGTLEALGVLSGVATACSDAARAVERVIEQHAAWATDGSGTAPATTLAEELAGSVPVIYGIGHTVVIAERWKAQINENGKLPAFANAYPELDHNEIVGWEGAARAGSRLSVIELHPASPGARAELRAAVTRELVEPDAAAVIRLAATERTRAGEVFELLVLGDYLSVALALRDGVNPTPVERIQALKARLADG